MSPRPPVLDVLDKICKKIHAVLLNQECGKWSQLFIVVHWDGGDWMY